MPIDIFLLASWIGGMAFALSGFLVGVRKNLDIMGIFILAFLTASGGGIIRDVLIGRTPLVLTDYSAFILVLLTFLVGVALHYTKNIDIEKRGFFIISDSIGLVAFSLTGALVGIDAGLNMFGVVVLSFITATGGGILRDVTVNEVPSVFESDFYGSISVLMAATIFGLHKAGLQTDMNIVLVFVAALMVRLLAYKFKWHLPKLKF
jgi:uncharacterized membrane protein YeiH